MPVALIPFFLLFIPILEIAAFILIGGQIGIMITLVLVLVTAILGSILLRIQSLQILGQIQIKIHAGELPGKELVNGVMILIAGIMLLTPGFVTDSIGFLVFFPPFRRLIWDILISRTIIRASGFSNSGTDWPHHSRQPPNEKNVVDLDRAEYSEAQTPAKSESGKPKGQGH